MGVTWARGQLAAQLDSELDTTDAAIDSIGDDAGHGEERTAGSSAKFSDMSACSSSK
jgi:hypothetical protein